MRSKRILLADDHKIIAEGLRALLEPEFEVVGIAADGHEMVETARRFRPDVVVADISMPILNGIEALAKMREAGVESYVIFLTMHREIAYARRAMDSGAKGYLLKHSAADELLTAVREVVRGQTYVTPLIAGELLGSYRGSEEGTGSDPRALTSRQREVLQLVAEGRSAKEIAHTLGISVRTAESHKARILEALGLRGTAELVQYAIRNGIISV